MQPSNDQRNSGWAGYARPGYEVPPPAVSVTRARPWLIALAAMGTTLVLMLAINNSAVTEKILRHSAESNGFFARALSALAVFGWDVGRLGSDRGNFYLSALLTDLAVLVLVLLLVAAVTRGRGSFGQVFTATWIAVIAACMVGSYVRPMVLDTDPVAQEGKATSILFSSFSPGPAALFTGILYGLVAALIAGFIGVRTRRTEVVTGAPTYGPPSNIDTAADDAPAAEPARREPWAAPPAAAGVPGPVANPSPWSKDSDSEHTTQMPAVDSSKSPDGEQHTTQLPRTEGGDGQSDTTRY